MLKIKDNVDLKELEKFGFKKIEWNYASKPYFENDLAIMKIDSKKGIDFTEYLGCTAALEEYQELLYDLIKADLVEKMEK